MWLIRRSRNNANWISAYTNTNQIVQGYRLRPIPKITTITKSFQTKNNYVSKSNAGNGLATWNQCSGCFNCAYLLISFCCWCCCGHCFWLTDVSVIAVTRLQCYRVRSHILAALWAVSSHYFYFLHHSQTSVTINGYRFFFSIRWYFIHYCFLRRFFFTRFFCLNVFWSNAFSQTFAILLWITN